MNVSSITQFQSLDPLGLMMKRNHTGMKHTGESGGSGSLMNMSPRNANATASRFQPCLPQPMRGHFCLEAQMTGQAALREESALPH